MTQFESNIFDFVESLFGREAAIKFYRFCSNAVATFINAAAAFMYMCYLFTLPVQFVKLVWKNLKEKGVI